MSSRPGDPAHRLQPMTGRDPNEGHRTATTLELIFDLTFVIGFGTTAAELSHALAENHVGTGVLAFALSSLAITWAWVNCTWFASAYDTDDWLYRLLTMVQMIGVLVLTLGIPRLYRSLAENGQVDNTVTALGYVVMRVPMVFQWLRAAKSDPAHRAACRLYAKTLIVAQTGWTVLAFASMPLLPTLAVTALIGGIEFGAPALVYVRHGGLPWHPHHLAERYGLLVIIALGEGLIGTMATLTSIFDASGWSVDFVLLGISGVGLTFSIWWSYFTFPSGDLLAWRRDAVRTWGYGHLPIFAAIVAMGAGLHACAYWMAGVSHLSAAGTVLAVALPVGMYVGILYGTYFWLRGHLDPLARKLLAISAVLLVGGWLLARQSGSLIGPLFIVAAVPWATVVGYEVAGHRRAQPARSAEPG